VGAVVVGEAEVGLADGACVSLGLVGVLVVGLSVGAEEGEEVGEVLGEAVGAGGVGPAVGGGAVGEEVKGGAHSSLHEETLYVMA